MIHLDLVGVCGCVFILLDVHGTFWIDGLMSDIPITFMFYFLKLSYNP